jgi:hypothetical protein
LFGFSGSGTKIHFISMRWWVQMSNGGLYHMQIL